jgi:hypothetical protein
MVPPKPQPSTPFASREFNGELLVQELDDLRALSVRQLCDLALAMRDLMGVRATEAAQKVQQLAVGRFSSPPSLAALLKLSAKKLKVDADVPMLISHFERLAITSAITNVIGRVGLPRK